MITFILPGYSKKNKEWADLVSKSLKIDGQIRPTYWDHWEDESASFDPQEKADLLARHAKGDKLNIVAKSVGTLIATLMTAIVPDLIEKMIFCGIPVNDLSKDEIRAIKTIIISKGKLEKLIVYQNSDDPHGTFKQAEELFPEFKIIEKKADNHEYPYYEEFQKFLK